MTSKNSKDTRPVKPKKITDVFIRNLKPEKNGKQKKYTIGDGLFLLVTAAGSKLWRYKYRFDGNEKSLSMGKYPVVSLADAKMKHLEAMKLLDQGKDPSAEKQAKKHKLKEQEYQFATIAREWHQKKSPEWTEKHSHEVLHSLERDIFPHIGKTKMDDINSPLLLKVLRRIESRGALVIVNKVRQRCEAVFKYAIITGRASYNPAIDLQGAFTSHKKANYRALERKDIPEFMEALDNCTSDRTIVLAIKFVIYTMARTSEVRFATWDEINWDDALWEIPEQRMKASRNHLVPLSRQAMAVLKDLYEMNGAYPFIFASYHKPHKQPMSENAMLSVVKKINMTEKTTIHGLRATASTILNEMSFNPDWIERALAHVPTNKVRAAYNRAQYLNDRADMLQQWADLVDSDSEKIVPIRKGKTS